MRTVVAILATALALTACSQPKPAEAPPAPEVSAPAVSAPSSVAESVAPDTVTIPPAIAAGTDLIEGLAQGGSATLVLDACPKTNFNERDRLGSVKCGGSYAVFYEASTQRWVSVGPNAITGKTAAGKNPGGAPSARVISVWGLSVTIDPSFNANVGALPVGHLVHSK